MTRPRTFLLLVLPLLAAPLGAQATTVDSAQALRLLRDSNFVAAARAYTELTTRQPGQPNHWSRLGQAEHGQGHFDKAEAAQLKALELYPATPPLPRRITWYNVAAARARQGKIDGAFTALDSINMAPWLTPQLLDGDPDMASLMPDARMTRLKARLALASAPCDTMPKAREFDFWIGDWNVYAPGGQLAGTNRIDKISNGCALLENWTANGGSGAGKSLNFYNANAGYWQQTWIGSMGGPVEFREGELKGTTLSFVARSTAPGNPIVSRLSFTNLGPNRVRQHAEATTDNGVTWTTSYDFQYLRKGSDERP